MERMKDVIRKTVNTYLGDHKSTRKICKRYQRAINQQIPDSLRELRNSFVHPTNMNWTKKVTAERNWEHAVVICQTPQIALGELLYPQLGRPFKSGDYGRFVNTAEMFLNDLGNILYALEQDLKANYNLKCPIR